MAKRYKPKVKEVKVASTFKVESKGHHKVHLIERGTYWDVKCMTCGRGAICGGLGAEGLLRDWANGHAIRVEIIIPGGSS